MNAAEIYITCTLVAIFFATLGHLIEKLTGKGVIWHCAVFYFIVVTLTAMYDIHQKNAKPKQKKVFNTEYQLELVNQNTVKIQATDTKKIYTCTPNQIDSVLCVDNL